MDAPVLCCTDGSDLSLDAVRTGLDLLGGSLRVVLLTAISDVDPTLVTGTGMAGGTMSSDEHDKYEEQKLVDAKAVLTAASTELGLDPGNAVVVRGSAGAAICAHAAEIG